MIDGVAILGIVAVIVLPLYPLLIKQQRDISYMRGYLQLNGHRQAYKDGYEKV